MATPRLPRVYRPAPFWLYIAVSAASMIGGMWSWYALSGSLPRALGLCAMAFGSILALWISRTRLTLYEDRIVIRRIASEHVVRRENVVWWHVPLVFDLRDPRSQVAVDWLLIRDPVLREWLNSLPHTQRHYFREPRTAGGPDSL